MSAKLIFRQQLFKKFCARNKLVSIAVRSLYGPRNEWVRTMQDAIRFRRWINIVIFSFMQQLALQFLVNQPPVFNDYLGLPAASRRGDEERFLLLQLEPEQSAESVTRATLTRLLQHSEILSAGLIRILRVLPMQQKKM